MSNKKKAQQSAPTRSRGSAMVQQQRAREKRRNVMIQGGIVLAAVLAVLLVTVAVLNARSASQPDAVPAGINGDGVYTIGDDDAPVTITVAEDLQCPVCKQFEETSGDKLRELAESGDAKIEYRGVAFLDRASSTEYSSRALNAWACVADQGDEDAWSAFHQAMYAQQPAEGGEGLTDAQLVDIATEAGADEDAVTSCIDDGTYRDWVTYTTGQATDAGIDGTPTVFVDGEVSEARTPEQLQAAVDEASS